MHNAIPVKVDGEVLFRSLSACERYMKGTKDHYGYGDEIIDSGEDFELLSKLLTRHPSSEQKIGPGIDHFKIARNRSQSFEFVVVRTDGTERTFSYKKVVRPHKDWQRKDLLKGLRTAVKPQANYFKRECFKKNSDSKGHLVCPESSLKFRQHEAHCDHVHPLTFSVLADWFLEVSRYSASDTGFSELPGTHITCLKNKEMEDDWKEFHQENSIFRVVFGKANIQGKLAKFENVDPESAYKELISKHPSQYHKNREISEFNDEWYKSFANPVNA